MTSRALPLILAAFVVLAGIYAVVTPPFEASDEIWHYPYVQYLQRGLGLPVQVPRPEDNLARQEGSQPPLYYALSAALTFLVDAGPPGSGVVVNPHAQVGVPLTPGNKNLAIHPAGERLGGAGLAVMIIRGMSIVLGAISIWLVFRLVALVFPDRPAVPLLAAGFTAFLPGFVFISAAVNNDNLMTTLGLATLYVIVLVATRPVTARLAVGLGTLIGLALLTKLTALGLVPLAGVALLISGWRFGRWQRVLGSGAATYAVAALIAGWWYVRNWLLYGEPTGVSMMLRIVNTRNPNPPIWELIAGEWEGFRLSFWALFGGVNVLADPAVYLIYDVLTLAALVGLAVVAIRRRPRLSVDSWITAGLMFGWTAIVTVGLLRWSQMTLASQGRLLFPSIAGIAMLAAVGWLGLLPPRAGRFGAPLMVTALALIALVLPFRSIAPAYAAPPPRTAAEVAELRDRLDIDFGGSIRLVNAEVPAGPYRFYERVPISITWQLLRPVESNYSVFVHLFGRLDRKVGQVDTYPGLGLRPFPQMTVGAYYRDTYSVLIDQLTEGPILLRAVAGVYDATTQRQLSATKDGVSITSSPIIGRVRLGDPPGDEGPTLLASGTFGNAIAVDGASFGPAVRVPNDSRPPAYAVNLYLRALTTPKADYTIFVQVIGPDGRLVTQRDLPPVEGHYPTTAWLPGERIVDRRELPFAALPAGSRLVVGFYDPQQRRLPRSDAGGDYLDLGPVG